MAHYAKVENKFVTQVIVAEADFFDSFIDSTPGNWIQTSFNTRHNAHTNSGTPLRANFAGVGYNYDSVNDVGIMVQYGHEEDGVWAYDYNDDDWIEKGSGPSDLNTEDGLACYDSESERLIVLESGNTGRYHYYSYDYT